MSKKPDWIKGGRFEPEDTVVLQESYLYDPSDVMCPLCGFNEVEVLYFLDTEGVNKKIAVKIFPDEKYIVVVGCHECGRYATFKVDPESQKNHDTPEWEDGDECREGRYDEEEWDDDEDDDVGEEWKEGNWHGDYDYE